MKVLMTGANGQLGMEMKDALPHDIELVSTDIDELDVTDRVAVETYVYALRPDAIINAAAYTAVDQAERALEKVFQINAEAVGYLAGAAQNVGARFVQVSTDFVFDGETPRPYKPDNKVNPLNVYGASKAEGEAIALAKTNGSALIVRTAWVYSVYGSNFVKTMLKLMAEGDEISVVADQIGTPTWAKGLACFLWEVLVNHSALKGVHHWTDNGVASWYDFAFLIQETAYNLKILDRRIAINAISSEQYPMLAKRPSCCVLDKSKSFEAEGLQPMHWSEALAAMLNQLRAG